MSEQSMNHISLKDGKPRCLHKVAHVRCVGHISASRGGDCYLMQERQSGGWPRHELEHEFICKVAFV